MSSPYCALVVLCDGRLLSGITGCEKVDRLPVIVPGFGLEQLPGVPKINSGAGEAQTSTVIRNLDEWNLTMKTKKYTSTPQRAINLTQS